jgi:hypothetical protein
MLTPKQSYLRIFLLGVFSAIVCYLILAAMHHWPEIKKAILHLFN